jgi:hypothetical protein
MLLQEWLSQDTIMSQEDYTRYMMDLFEAEGAMDVFLRIIPRILSSYSNMVSLHETIRFFFGGGEATIGLKLSYVT